MSNKTPRTNFLAGDFISENAVRGVIRRRRRRRTRPTTPTEPQNGLSANVSNSGEDTSWATRRRRPLRRWSVAELIAGAGATPNRTA